MSRRDQKGAPIVSAMCAVLVLATASTARAQTSSGQDHADLQCMAITAVGAGTVQAGSEAQMGMVAGFAFYLGRLQGRTPEVNWLTELQTYLADAYPADAKTQAVRCGHEMIAFGGELTRWGEMMQALAAKDATAQK